MIMTTPYFDTLYYDHIEGTIEDPVVKDADNTPNRVLELDRDWQVEIKWSLKSDAPASHPVDLLDGTWVVKISVESIGPGNEKDVASVNLPFLGFDTSSAAQRTWKHNFMIPAGTITDEAVYQLVTLITYRDPDGNRRAMAGFTEGPMVTFYQD
jgi:hypothetical protein